MAYMLHTCATLAKAAGWHSSPSALRWLKQQYDMQITALGNPKLLERVAAGLMAIRNLFSQFDLDMNNVITREEFIKVIDDKIHHSILKTWVLGWESALRTQFILASQQCSLLG